jgi:hypothetical protein
LTATLTLMGGPKAVPPRTADIARPSIAVLRARSRMTMDDMVFLL